MTKAQKITLAIIIIIILLLIIAIAAFIGSGNVSLVREVEDKSPRSSENLTKAQSEEAARETQKLIDEAREIAQEVEDKKLNGEKIDDNEFSEIVYVPNIEERSGTSTAEEKEAVIIAPGSNMVAIDTGEVLTDDGEVVDNTLDPEDPNSPRQSFSINDASSLPESTIKLTISEGNIEPAEFSVKAGQVVSIAVKSTSLYGDIFRFESPELKGVSVGVGSNETRSITFNAPASPGDYTYFSDVRKQKQNGAVGVMKVE